MDAKPSQFLGVGQLGGGGSISQPMSHVKVIEKSPKPSLKIDIKSEYGKSK